MNSREYFDSVAEQWDEMQQGFFSEAVREKAYAVAGVEEGKTAADIGAGTGFVTEGLLQRGVRVIAVDQSEAMLQQMMAKLPDLGVDYTASGKQRISPSPTSGSTMPLLTCTCTTSGRRRPQSARWRGF